MVKGTYTPASLAKELGRTTKTVRNWMTAGVRGVRLRASMLGGRWSIEREDVDEFFKATTKKAVGGNVIVPESESARRRRREANLADLREMGVNV